MGFSSREARLAYYREYNRNRREKQIAYARQWRRDYPERALASHRQWKERYPDRARDLWRRMHQLRRGGGLVPEDLGMLYVDPCAYCGGAAGEVDHIVPVIAGGDSSWENLTAACRSCNASKSRKGLLEFLVGRTRR